MRNVYIVLIAVVLAVAGCDGKKDQQPGGGNILRHGLRARIQTLDPAQVGDVPTDAVASEFFETLYTLHYLKRPYEVIPAVAEAMPQISDDGLEYTIKIKKGIYFHDDECFEGGKGRELVAGDFVYAWMRMANVKSSAKMWWIFDNKIVGLDEFREYTKTVKKDQVDYSREVEGLKALDDHTLFIKLKKPWPQIMYILTYLPSAPMAKEAVDHYGKQIVSHPVGTGPFKLKMWARGSYIVAVRNTNYRRVLYPSQGAPGDEEKGLLADAGKVIPFVDGVTWQIVTEDQPRWLMFLQGDIDIAGIPKDNFGQAVAMGRMLTKEMKGRDINLDMFREADTFWVGMNMDDPALANNKYLRYAISAAIDKQKWIDLFFNGRGDSAYGFIPPVMEGYDEDIKDVSHAVYDVEKGKQLLEKAKEFAGGQLPPLRLTISGTDTTYRQMGQFLQMCLAQIGLDIEVEYFDWPTYLEKLRKKDVQMFSSGWMADYPDVENFLQIFYSKNTPWPNSFNYSSPQFDKIYEQASVMADSDERTQLYRKAQRIVVEDAPCAFIYHRTFYAMSHNWIGNFKPNSYKPDSFGFGLSKYYKVDTAKRAAYQEKYK